MTSQTGLRLLVIDDELDHCELIKSCMESAQCRDINVTFAHTVAEACDAIRDRQFDCVMLDHNLPDGHGTQVLDEMETELLTIPVIGLSTSTDPEVALADFNGGAASFLCKHQAFVEDTLYRHVVAIVSKHKRRTLAAVTQMRAESTGVELAQDELLAAARLDPLLGILNRGAFEEVLRDVHACHAIEGKPYTICLADVDQFKKYNDTYGHAAGDTALRAVADALKAALRPHDYLGRYGGEELVIVLGGLGDVNAIAVIDRLVQQVAAANIPHESNPPHGRVTVSLGAATLDPAEPLTADELLQLADEAMYAAKDRGRNRALRAPVSTATGS